MTDPQFQVRGEIPAIAAQIAATRTRDYLHGRYVQASVAADRPGATLADAQEADRIWDAYADECARLGQCTWSGCYTPSPHRAYCPAHDENPPDYGD